MQRQELAPAIDVRRAVLAAVVVVVISLYWWILKQRKKAPGPLLTLPFVGEALSLKFNPAGFMLDRYLRYGPIYRTSILGVELHFILEPKWTKRILRGDDVTFAVPFPSFEALIGNMEHMADGPIHSYWRRAMGVSLSPTAVDQYIPALMAVIDKAITQWEQMGRLQVLPVTRSLAVEFALEVLVGVRLQHTDKAWFREKLMTWIAGLYTAPVDLPFTTFRKAKLAKQELEAALATELVDMVAALKAEAAAQGQDTLGSFLHDEQKLSDSLEKLKNRRATTAAPAGAPAPAAAAAAGPAAAGGLPASMADVNVEVLRAQGNLDAAVAAARIIGIFLAAVDTTRYFLLIIMIILDELPEELEKLRQEQQQVLDTYGEELSMRTLAAMPYLDSVLKEAMRLVPAARVGMRRALKDLDFDGTIVPKGSILVYSIDALHVLDPTLWKGPQESLPQGRKLPEYMDFRGNLRGAFQPSRWMEGGDKPRNFTTFGAGAHLCLGMNLVNTELKLFLAQMMRRGCSWRMEERGLLKRFQLFPAVGPPVGTDWMEFRGSAERVMQPKGARS